MAALRGTELVAADLSEAVGTLKTVPDELIKTAELFFG
jgi:hypothetical protein